MAEDRLRYLLHRYFTNSATNDENQELMELVQNSGNDQTIKEVMEEVWSQDTHEPVFSENKSEELFLNVLESANSPSPVVTYRSAPRWRSLAAAAAVLLLLLGAGWWFINKPFSKKPVAAKSTPATIKNDIQPGSNKATLQLADGSTISLDNTINRSLARQGNVQVVQSDSGRLEYITNLKDKQPTASYNMLKTPRGGQFQLVLPDGTQVWLNAASSIKYPTQFMGNERRVEITGEAYFEVTKNSNMPFKVTISNTNGGTGSEITVLGTHFNVNAYDDEHVIRTTLLEGSVAVRQPAKEAEHAVVLKPGEQAMQARANSSLTTHHSPFTINHSADVEQVVAWKNGFFQYKSADIASVMRQVARWYDLNIIYTGNIPTDRFTGKLPRSVSLSRLLKWFEWSDIHFKIEGNNLIVNQ